MLKNNTSNWQFSNRYCENVIIVFININSLLSQLIFFAFRISSCVKDFALSEKNVTLKNHYRISYEILNELNLFYNVKYLFLKMGKWIMKSILNGSEEIKIYFTFFE